ncbi:LysR family transcriptional regulator [Komagataeibacter europaeus]|uniref:LysR family transcriptional regulator n=1 Tax=Komagataeibacter europaeus TaxID=33995 RepID=UPI0002E7D75E|nr:LysR family transcriptional regulator [Komagataeibacter europaeus]GBQ40266.1 LysR family transcriptional regulator [Komagataeibacter europaeus LMG 18890]
MISSDLPFDLHALKVFLQVCEHTTMAGAARRLGITQSAISQVISDLEHRLGVVLFDRSMRPIGLTASGALLREHALILTTEARRASIRLQELQRGRPNLLRVGIIDSLSRALLPPLTRFLRERAERSVILSGPTESHYAALLGRQMDLIVGAGDLEDMNGLECWVLLEEPYVLLYPATKPYPDGPKALQEINQYMPFIRFSARSRIGQDIERYLRRLRLELRYSLEFDSPFGVTSACMDGGMAITTPLCMLECGEAVPHFRCMALPGPPARRQLTLIVRKGELGRLPFDLVQTLRQHLRDSVLQRLRHFCPDDAKFLKVPATRVPDHG